MQYGKIVTTGFSQAWKHKTLWIFGFFISGGGISHLGDIADKFNIKSPVTLDPLEFQRLIVDNIALVLLIAVLAFTAFILWLILSTISVGGLVHAAGQMRRGEPYSFSAAFKSGAAHFWQLLGIMILTIVVTLAFLIMLILSGFVAFKLHTALGVLSLLVLVPALIVGLFVVTITTTMAQRYIVLYDRPVFDGIADGFNLWKSNLLPSVAYTLIYLGISVAILLGMLVVIAYVVIPFVAIGFVNVAVAIILGVPVLLLALIVVDGLTGSATHLMTTEFFFQLLEEPRAATAAIAVDTTPAPPFSAPPSSDLS